MTVSIVFRGIIPLLGERTNEFFFPERRVLRKVSGRSFLFTDAPLSSGMENCSSPPFLRNGVDYEFGHSSFPNLAADLPFIGKTIFSLVEELAADSHADFLSGVLSRKNYHSPFPKPEPVSVRLPGRHARPFLVKRLPSSPRQRASVATSSFLRGAVPFFRSDNVFSRRGVM